jgi:hypothetical protein
VVCCIVVLSVKVWRKVSLMWTGSESVKGDRIVLYNCREQIVWVVGNVVFSVKVWRKVFLMWTGSDSVNGDMIVLFNCRERIVWFVVMWCLVLKCGEK